ncbi:MAG: glycosyltransferase family 4 protein [Peptococcaceae bacterium]|nr:glycosyltransferase family 4 protein [Peptococcaceae bacterium]
MRVLMLSWEYPPKSVGGLAQHVYDLTAALAKEGVEVHLITSGARGAADYEDNNGVYIYRVAPSPVSTPDFLTWVIQFNLSLVESAIQVLKDIGDVQVVHAHDWLVAYAARVLKHAYRLPLVTTIHATEFGRHNGLHNPVQNYISSVEWWLCYESWQIIVCSRYMHGEVKYIFQVPDDKLQIIYNGVDPANFTAKSEQAQRNSFAAPNEKIVFFVGRLVREKGVQVLLEAVPKVLQRHPDTKFIISGKGPYENNLKDLAFRLGIAQRVYFTGYIGDDIRNSLYDWADVAVFPSLYEPFGIVALEAMAAKTPVIVSDTGGLKEIVDDGVDGLKVHPGDSEDLANKIVAVLTNPSAARLMQERAYRKVVTQFDWQRIARQTKGVYSKVWQSRQKVDWPAKYNRRGHFFGKVYELFARH